MLIPILMSEGDASAAAVDPGLFVGVAFDVDPGPGRLGHSAFFDVTDDVLEWGCRRVRQFELDRFEAGVASVLLDDIVGDYDNTNPAGAHAPNVVPMRRLHIWAHGRDRFQGTIERWIPDWQRPGYQTASIVASDGFDWLLNEDVNTGYATLTVDPAGADDAYTLTAREAGEAGQAITYQVNVLNPGPASVTVTVTGTAILVECEIITHDTNAVLAALAASTAAMALVSVALVSGNDGTGSPGTLAATALTGGTWPQELSGARINRVLDEVGWPADARQIDAGLYEVVGYGSAAVAALTHMQDTADSELGYVFVSGGTCVFHDGNHRSVDPLSTVAQATFSDDEIGYNYESLSPSLDRDKIINRAVVTAAQAGAVAQVVVDEASRTRYRPRSKTLTTQLTSDADALDLAQRLIAAYKTPFERFESIEIAFVDNDPNVAAKKAATIGLDVGHRINVRANPPGHNTTVAFDCFVEGIWDIGARDQLAKVGLQLSPTGQSTSAPAPPPPGGGGALKDSSGDDLVLDSATLGVLG